jgi:hypothetical protein
VRRSRERCRGRRRQLAGLGREGIRGDAYASAGESSLVGRAGQQLAIRNKQQAASSKQQETRNKKQAALRPDSSSAGLPSAAAAARLKLRLVLMAVLALALAQAHGEGLPAYESRGWLGCSEGGLPLAEIRAVEGGDERHDISEGRSLAREQRKKVCRAKISHFVRTRRCRCHSPNATALLLADQDTLTH